MGQATTQAALLDWARHERAGWELLLAEVGEARLDAAGAMGDWTFKDLLDHLEAWQRFSQARLEQPLTGERPAPPWPAGLDDDDEADTDRINDSIHDATRDRPRAETVRAARRTWDRLEEGLAALPEAALVDPGHFRWMVGAALGPAVVRDATAHFHQDHEADVREWLAGLPATG